MNGSHAEMWFASSTDPSACLTYSEGPYIWFKTLFVYILLFKDGPSWIAKKWKPIKKFLEPWDYILSSWFFSVSFSLQRNMVWLTNLDDFTTKRKIKDPNYFTSTDFFCKKITNQDFPDWNLTLGYSLLKFNAKTSRSFFPEA